MSDYPCRYCGKTEEEHGEPGSSRRCPTAEAAVPSMMTFFDPSIKFGFYSQRALDERGVGTSIYSTPESGDVEVTHVTRKQSDGESYKWPDKVFVGPVVNWIRQGKPRTDIR